jgi:hypothetical protein
LVLSAFGFLLFPFDMAILPALKQLRRHHAPSRGGWIGRTGEACCSGEAW